MDQNNDENQSMDGMRPNNEQAPVSNVDGFVTSKPTIDTTQNIQDVSAANTSANNATEAPAPAVEVATLKAQKKGMAIWLVVLLVIIFTGAAATAVYFYQANQATQDLNAEKAKTSQAQKDLAAQKQSATQEQVNTLNAEIKTLTDKNATLTTQNAALQKTVDSQTAYIKTLTATATQLKTTCGSACSSITIPPAPTTTTTN